MYSNLPTDIRDEHPYHMYEEIRLQPEVVARSVLLAQQHGAPAVRAVARSHRVFLTGCGTSLHAARVGAWMLALLSRGKIDARAVDAFDLVSYLPGLRPDDVVIAVTHSGGTTMTVRALERTRRAGAESIVVTGFDESPAGRLGHYVLPTGYGEERSWAHTASYTAALASLLTLANDVAVPEERLDLSPLRDVMEHALGLEEMAHRMAASSIIAERYRGAVRIVVVGGGPNAVTAQEAVLKFLETSYAQAEAFELEMMLHGPLAAITPETLLIIVAPEGPSADRAAALARAAHAIGTVPVVLTSSEHVGRFEDAHRLVLPDVPEIISPLAAIVPLQFFSYFLAVGGGANPDLLHRDDERYRAARAQYD